MFNLQSALYQLLQNADRKGKICTSCRNSSSRDLFEAKYPHRLEVVWGLEATFGPQVAREMSRLPGSIRENQYVYLWDSHLTLNPLPP